MSPVSSNTTTLQMERFQLHVRAQDCEVASAALKWSSKTFSGNRTFECPVRVQLGRHEQGNGDGVPEMWNLRGRTRFMAKPPPSRRKVLCHGPPIRLATASGCSLRGGYRQSCPPCPRLRPARRFPSRRRRLGSHFEGTIRRACQGWVLGQVGNPHESPFASHGTALSTKVVSAKA